MKNQEMLKNWLDSHKNHVLNQDEIDLLKPIQMLRAISELKFNQKELDEKRLTNSLNAVITEMDSYGKYKGYLIQVFLRNLCDIGSVQREHNIHKSNLIKIENPTGNQLRTVGRFINRWMFNNPMLKNWLSQRDENGYLMNLNIWFEYSNYGQGIWNQINTTYKKCNSKNPSTLISKETMGLDMIQLVLELMSQNISYGNGLSNIARWLPKGYTTTKRVNKFTVGKNLKRKTFVVGNKEVKLNGVLVKGTVSLKDGDLLVVSRKMKSDAIERGDLDNWMIKTFCAFLGWDKTQYKEFRSKYMSLTPEAMFSTKKILEFSYDEFNKWYNGLSMGQQHVVSATVLYKEGENLKLKENSNFGKIGEFMLMKIKEQNKILENVRIEMSKVGVEKDESKIQKMIKQTGLKTTGLSTMDLLVDLLQQKKSENDLNNLHTALIGKMKMEVPVFCIIDGSGSMTSRMKVKDNVHVSYLDIAMTMALTFMVTNPIEEFRSSLMWFGSEAQISGYSQFVDKRPNGYLDKKNYTKKNEISKIVDPKLTFTKNLQSLRESNPDIANGTNMGSCVTTFINLVKGGKMYVEQLPKVLLFITDNEYNIGVDAVQKDGKGFTQIPLEIGWNPLFVFWGLGRLAETVTKYKDSKNVILLSGFNESTLTSLLQNVSKGSLDLYDSLYAVNDNPVYDLIRI